MAKAGLFIPTAHQLPTRNPVSLHCRQHSKQQQQQQQESQHPDPRQSNQQQQQGSHHRDPPLSDKQQQESQCPDAQQSDQQQQQPMVVFFDKVLADVGDSQNLQQSLSTFSGHIRRVRSILQEATPHSLVLLDEVGMPLLMSVCCFFPMLLTA